MPKEEQQECPKLIFESVESMDNPTVETYILNIMKILYTEEVSFNEIFLIHFLY